MILEKLNQLMELVTLSLESNHISLICAYLRHLYLIYGKFRDVSLEINYIKKGHLISFHERLPILGVE